MKLKYLLNPFEKIAGLPALFAGLVALIVSVVAALPIDFHYHGLLHFGAAPNNAWWVFPAERLLVWLFPSLLFYVAGRFLSKSNIRLVDVFGTVAFAQIPLTLFVFYNYLPPMRLLNTINLNQSIQEIVETPGLITASAYAALGIIFIVVCLIWMFHALRVSCNLKGGRLWFAYLLGVFGGDILCRTLINLMY